MPAVSCDGQAHWAEPWGPGLFFCFSIDLNNKEVNSGAFLVDKSPKLMSISTSIGLKSG
jgi:hypothetical protein